MPTPKTNKSLIEEVLKQEVALDIETLGIPKGSGIVELSLHDPNTNTVHQFRVSPNLTVTEASLKFQDTSELRSSGSDVLSQHPLVRRARELELQQKIGGKGQSKSISWKDTVVAQVLMDDSIKGKGVFEQQIRAAFPKGTAPALTAHGFESMSDKDFNTVFSAIKRITEGAGTKGEIQKTVRGKQYGLFQAGIEESSPFLRRAYASNPYFRDLISEEHQPGRIRTATADTPVDSKIGALRRDLAAYSGSSDLKLRVYDVTPEELLDPEKGFLKNLKNKNVQMAYSAFESKQIGALVGASEAEIQRKLKNKQISQADAAVEMRKASAIRGVFAETPVGVSDIMPISGKSVNKARTQAQVTGDYTGLFRPMLEEMSSGKNARVTDILDFTRIQSSYEQKLGLKPTGTPNLLSVDVAQRLYGYSENAANALTKVEKHIGAFDTLSQSAVTRSALLQTEALSEVFNRTERGMSLIQQAKNQEGLLHKALVLSSVKGEASKFIEEANVMTRLSRAGENLATKGVSSETTGTFKLGGKRTRLTPSGSLIEVSAAVPSRYTDLSSLDDVLAHIKKQPNYRHADMNKAVGLFVQSVNEGRKAPVISFDEAEQKFSTTAEFSNLTKGDFKNAENLKRKHIDSGFQNLSAELRQGNIPGMSPESMRSHVAGLEKKFLAKNSFLSRHGNWKHIDFKAGKFAGVMAAGMGAVGMLGLIGDTISNIGVRQQRGGPETLRTMNYDRWFQANSEFHGMESQQERGNSGFSERGMGAVQRKQRTDFGSPYQGPQYSQYVLEQQDLLNERRKYEMNMFAHTHFSNEGVIGNYINSVMMSKDASYSLNSFVKSVSLSNRLMSSGNKFISEGSWVPGKKYGGLNDQNLFKVDLSKYRISASDADTIVLKRKGTGNPIAKFFGMDNDSISVRLAGIDAPELAHGDKKGQPLGNRALGRLKALMNQGKNLELLIDPTNITYGRQVGSLFVDGQNVQMDLIKGGDVKFLNFKKGGMQQFNPQMYSKVSRLAQENTAGIYGDPYFQPLIEFEKRSKQSVTFNTMVNIPKISQNSNLMSIYGVMNAADRMGMYTPAMAKEAALIGERTTTLSGDYKNQITFGTGNTPHKDYIDYLAYDNTTLMKSRGSNISNRMQRNSGYGNLDKHLALDTAGTSTNSYNKRKYQVFDTFGTDKQMKTRRRISMQAMQQDGLRKLRQSPINHHRM